ncbi:MAG: hypothetical protein ACYSWO_00690 [Planctomycetota bacterium]|jgi:hypothetical protein
MSQIETQDVLSEDMAGAGDNDSMKLVPVAESIRYRKRAQSAEKKIEVLTEQLAEANAQTAQISEQLSSIEAEQKLMRELAAAGTVDMETAVLIAKARMQDQNEADLSGVIEQLKNEKQYLFGGATGTVTAKKTAGARERMQSNETMVEKAAKKAATTGSRVDLQEYLKLRRNYL